MEMEMKELENILNESLLQLDQVGHVLNNIANRRQIYNCQSKKHTFSSNLNTFVQSNKNKKNIPKYVRNSNFNA